MKRQSPDKTAFARELRRRQTDAEALLWSYVRNRGLVRENSADNIPSVPMLQISPVLKENWLLKLMAASTIGRQHQFKIKGERPGSMNRDIRY